MQREWGKRYSPTGLDMNDKAESVFSARLTLYQQCKQQSQREE